MPTTLLTVETHDMSSAVLARVQQAIALVNKQMLDEGVTARQALTIAGQQEAAASRYAALQTRLAAATAQYEQATLRATAAQRQQQDVAAAQGRTSEQYAAATTATTAAMTDQATKGLRLADVYRQMASAEDQLSKTTQRVDSMLNAPLRTPPAVPGTPGTAGTSGGGKTFLGGLQESFLGQYILYGIGYQIGSQLLTGLQQSLANNQQLSVLAGQTAASTGLGMSGVNWLQSYAEQTAQSGTQPYDAKTVLTGLYGPLSQGFKNPAQAIGINTIAIGLSQIAGATDTTPAAGALLSLGNAFGWGQNTAQSSQHYANLLQAGTNIGAYTLSQISQSLPNAGLAALNRSGFNAPFVMAAMATGSYAGVTPEQTAQNLNSLGQSVANPTTQQQSEARLLGIHIGPGAFQQAGGAFNWFAQMQQRMAAMSPALQQQAMARLFGNQSAGQLVSEMLGGTGPRSFGSVYGYMQHADTGRGYYATALKTEGQTPGQKLADAETQLKQSMDTMTKSLLPVEQQLVTGLGAIVTAIDNWIAALPKGNPASGIVASLGAALGIGQSPASNQRALEATGNRIDSLVGQVETTLGPIGAAVHNTTGLGGASVATMGIPFIGPFVAPVVAAAEVSRHITAAHPIPAPTTSVPSGLGGAGPGGPMTTSNIPAFLHNLTGWGLPSGGGNVPAAPPVLVGAGPLLPGQTRAAPSGLVGAGPLLPGQTRVALQVPLAAGLIGPLLPGGAHASAPARGPLPPASVTGGVARGVPQALSRTQVPFGFIGPLLPGETRTDMRGSLGAGVGQPPQPHFTAQQLAIARAQQAVSIAGGGGGTLAMQNAKDSLQAAMLEYLSPTTVAGLFTTYQKAVKADTALTPATQQLDIAQQQRQFWNYTSSWYKHYTLPPFFNPNPGMGGLQAGFGATAVRFGGGQDPQAVLIAKLEQKVAQDNVTIKSLLAQIAANTGRLQLATARTTPLAGTGTNRSPHS